MLAVTNCRPLYVEQFDPIVDCLEQIRIAPDPHAQHFAKKHKILVLLEDGHSSKMVQTIKSERLPVVVFDLVTRILGQKQRFGITHEAAVPVDFLVYTYHQTTLKLVRYSSGLSEGLIALNRRAHQVTVLHLEFVYPATYSLNLTDHSSLVVPDQPSSRAQTVSFNYDSRGNMDNPKRCYTLARRFMHHVDRTEHDDACISSLARTPLLVNLKQLVLEYLGYRSLVSPSTSSRSVEEDRKCIIL